MVNFNDNLGNIRAYFENTIKTYGATPMGVDWNSDQAREIRFDQLAKVIDLNTSFTLLDYGSGYGAFVDYLSVRGYKFSQYIGYDILESMVNEARKQHHKSKRISFTSDLSTVPVVDFAIACGVFNMKLQAKYEEWTNYVLKSLSEMNNYSKRGFAANFLTKYSDPDRMRPDLYYADPCFLFDHCKQHFSKNVAILHDYNLFDFTILVRK